MRNDKIGVASKGNAGKRHDQCTSNSRLTPMAKASSLLLQGTTTRGRETMSKKQFTKHVRGRLLQHPQGFVAAALLLMVAGSALGAVPAPTVTGPIASDTATDSRNHSRFPVILNHCDVVARSNIRGPAKDD